MNKKQYIEEAYCNLRGWLHELNTNKHGLRHLAEDAITLLKKQIKHKKK